MSSPAVAEQTGWQSRRVRRLPRSAALYAVAVCLAAAAGAVASVAADGGDTHDFTAFLLLLPLAAAAPLFRVAVGRNYSLHTGPAFIVAGALVLPPLMVLGLVAALHIPQILRQRYPWYIHVFNLANNTLSALAAWLAVSMVGAGSDLRFALCGLAATFTFVLVNHTLLAVMLRLGRGHGFRASGLFSPSGLAIELVIAGLGVALGAFAGFNPWLLPALIAPLVLAHRSFSTLALLRESEERFRTMFESAPTAMMMLDTGGRVVAVNRSSELILGYDEHELLGADTPMLRHPEDAEELAGLLEEVTRGERDVFRRESRYISKAGETVAVQLAVALVRDADGRPDYVIAMAEDVSEQKQLEERLRQSQKLEAIGRLAGGVAHDFNNMLTAIGGYTGLALEHAETGSALHRDLEEVRKATDRAALLTRQLLAFSRKQVLVPELLNLNGIVIELETMLQPLIGDDVVLTTELEPALGPIEADPGQLQQVVMNLVVNARDAMPGGGVVTVATANADVGENEDAMERGRYVTLTVRDTGEGIDEGTLLQIFEPFFTTKDAGKGTGLGLATVYGIVKQSGGYVAVESEVGVGSAFTIYLRRADGVVQPALEPPSVPLVEAALPATPASMARVLVVEDEEVIRGLVDQVLSAEGYDVVVAADGHEALGLAARRPVDVLLTDLTMPGIGGQELADRLRERIPGLKVMFMSGFAEGSDFSALALTSSTTFLEKPFTFSTLTERMRELIDEPAAEPPPLQSATFRR
jgi:two-component system cell cycle sensor histidine kinase/response regulator CckA